MVGSPLRSSRALVATVVPILTASTRPAGIGSPAGTPSRRRIPATAASRYRPGFSDRSLHVTRLPSGRRPTTSVNVPPRSIQNSQRPSLPSMSLIVHHGRVRWSGGLLPHVLHLCPRCPCLVDAPVEG